MAFALAYYTKDQNIQMPDIRLYEYQINKIKNTKDVDTIFLGDSSLGDGINAELWSKLSHKKALNLGLTGNFGYEGAYNILQTLLFEGHNPKNLIIFFEPKQITMGVSSLSLAQTSPYKTKNESQFIENMKMFWLLNISKDGVIFNIKKIFDNSQKVDDQMLFENDFMIQKPTKREKNRFDFSSVKFTLSVNDINPKKIYYLEKINEICRKYKINCIYVHGPVAEQFCNWMVDFKPKAEEFISKSGLKIVNNSPICPPSEDMGDTINHIHPEMKDHYTKKYYKIINPYLDTVNNVISK